MMELRKSRLWQGFFTHNDVDVQLLGSCLQAAEKVLGSWLVTGRLACCEGLLQQQQGRAGDQLGGHCHHLALTH